jgi:hypothetical protein
MNSPTSSESFIKMEAGGRNFRITCDQPIKTRPKTLTEKAREENNKLKVEKVKDQAI